MSFVAAATETALKGAIVVLGAAAASIVLNVLWQLFWPKDPRAPPIVFSILPWVGCAVSYGMDPVGFLERNRKKFGPVFTYRLMGRWITAALGPAGNDFVLNSETKYVNAEAAYTNFTTPVFGDEVVYDVPNARFMEQKKFVKVGLTNENFKRYVGLITDETDDYFNREVFKGSSAPQSRDAFKLSSQITILTSSATLQGREVRKGLNSSFADYYHDLDGGFTPINFVFPQLPLPSYWRRDNAQRKMAQFYIDILKQRRASKEPPENDMLTALENQHYKNGERLSDKQIAHIMIALLMAGQHTSATTGAWAILHLASRPDLQDELYKEQQEHWGNPDGSFRELDYDNLHTPLLNAFIKEVLRLHAPLHSLMRKVLLDCPVPASLTTPSDPKRKSKTYVVPKGNFVLASPGLNHVDKSHWGADATEFDPSRWNKPLEVQEDEGLEDFGWGAVSKGGKSFYLPFGAGRHRCIGEQFAHLQLETILAVIVRKYVVSLDQPFPGNDYSTMIITPQQPCNVTFTLRK